MRASQNQRLRLLLAPALPRPPREERNRGAALPARRLARVTTEAVTLVSPNPRPDDVYEELRGQFSEEVVKLTVAVAAIKAWNRIAISFHAVHRVRKPHAA